VIVLGDCQLPTATDDDHDLRQIHAARQIAQRAGAATQQQIDLRAAQLDPDGGLRGTAT
jgi:hypothetical protein